MIVIVALLRRCRRPHHCCRKLGDGKHGAMRYRCTKFAYEPQRGAAVRLSVPTARRGGLRAVLRAVWTAPTTWVGFAAAAMTGCGRGERIGSDAARAWRFRL